MSLLVLKIADKYSWWGLTDKNNALVNYETQLKMLLEYGCNVIMLFKKKLISVLHRLRILHTRFYFDASIFNPGVNFDACI